MKKFWIKLKQRAMLVQCSDADMIPLPSLFVQVNLEAKVICSSSIPRALTREAEFTDAKFLIVGRSKNTYHR